MNRKIISGTVLTLLITGMLTSAFNIQPIMASETIYIRADGSIEPSTAPIEREETMYIFTDNIHDSIVIERDNIVIDGAGHALLGSGVYESIGILLFERSNVTIKNLEITRFESGIYLHQSSNITISGSNMTDNESVGIYLEYSSNSNITGNNIINSYSGITLSASSNNTISDNEIIQDKIWFGMMRGISLYGWSSSGNNIISNNIENHCDDGIHIEGSGNNIIGNNMARNGGGIWLQESSNILRNNSMVNNTRNFQVSGRMPYDFGNDVDTTNTVDGKPVYYWIDRRDIVVPFDAGYVVLVYCSNITAKNLNLTNNGQGILLVKTTNSTITSNNMMNNWYGIELSWSDYNNIDENNMTNNGYGIFLHDSEWNSISGNNMTDNEDFGIQLQLSSNNFVQENLVTNTVYETGIWDYRSGIWIGGSSNILSRNIVNGCNYSFAVHGDLPSHSIDSSNLVNGKPVYYLVNIKNKVINPSTHSQVGYLALVQCINITVEGITLANNSRGLLISNTNNSKIVGNNIMNNGYGVYSEYSSNTLISGNNITNNVDGGGIDLYRSINNSVSGNNIANNRHGISLGQSSNNNICRNSITANKEYAIWMNEYGIRLWNCSNNSINGNNITDNWNGIRLQESSNISISGNSIIASQSDGIEFYESANNTIYGNNIDSNMYGVCIDTASVDNSFYHNSFVNNTYQVYSEQSTNIWDDGYLSGGNYWSNYNGTDLDGDGIGDTSYLIDATNQDRYPLMHPYVLLGDLNTDDKVDVKDIAIFALAFGSYPEHPRWNPIADTDNNMAINILDGVIIAKNFGSTIYN